MHRRFRSIKLVIPAFASVIYRLAFYGTMLQIYFALSFKSRVNVHKLSVVILEIYMINAEPLTSQYHIDLKIIKGQIGSLYNSHRLMAKAKAHRQIDSIKYQTVIPNLEESIKN